MPKLLTEAQAKAVYEAMATLNNVGGLLHCRIINEDETAVHVKEYLTDEVNVWLGDCIDEHKRLKVRGHTQEERYANQKEFASAYGVE